MNKIINFFVLALSCFGSFAQNSSIAEERVIIEVFDPCVGSRYIPKTASKTERENILKRGHLNSTNMWSIVVRKNEAIGEEALIGVLELLGTEGFRASYIASSSDSIYIEFGFDPSSFYFGGHFTKAYQAKEAAFKKFIETIGQGVYMDCIIPPQPAN